MSLGTKALEPGIISLGYRALPPGQSPDRHRLLEYCKVFSPWQHLEEGRHSVLLWHKKLALCVAPALGSNSVEHSATTGHRSAPVLGAGVTPQKEKAR